MLHLKRQFGVCGNWDLVVIFRRLRFISRLATTTVHDKHVSRSSNSKAQADSAVHYQNSDTRAERLPKEKYELQNEEELSVAMVRKKPWVALTVTRTKESRPYGYVVMITPLDITVGRTRILMTTELNNLPLLINEYCA